MIITRSDIARTRRDCKWNFDKSLQDRTLRLLAEKDPIEAAREIATNAQMIPYAINAAADPKVGDNATAIMIGLIRVKRQKLDKNFIRQMKIGYGILASQIESQASVEEIRKAAYLLFRMSMSRIEGMEAAFDAVETRLARDCIGPVAALVGMFYIFDQYPEIEYQTMAKVRLRLRRDILEGDELDATGLLAFVEQYSKYYKVDMFDSEVEQIASGRWLESAQIAARISMINKTRQMPIDDDIPPVVLEI